MGMLLTAAKSDTWREAWRQQDLWANTEFAMLCCGWNPGDFRHGDGGPAAQQAYNEAREAIRRAVKAGAIGVVSWKMLEDRDERWFDTVAEFRPQDVIGWASERYPATFPYKPAERDTVEKVPTALSARLQALIGIAGDLDPGLSQKEIAERIRRGMSVQEREAQAYAALIRPDDAVARDRRAARRRD